MNKQNPHKSSSDFKRFLANKLNDVELQSFNNEISNSEFEKEAFEGYQLIENKEALKVLQEVEIELAKKIGKTAERKLILPYWKVLGVAASLAIFVVLGFGISQLLEKPQEFAKNEVEIEPTNSNELSSISTTASDSNELPQILTNLESASSKPIVTESVEYEKLEQKTIGNEGQKTITANSIGAAEADFSTTANEDLNLEESETDFYVVSPNKVSAAAKSESVTTVLAVKEEVKLDKTNYFQSGKLNFDSKNYGDAISNFEKSISNKQNVIEAQYYLGLIYTNTNKSTKAIKYYDAVIASNSSLSPNALWYKAALLIQKGDNLGAKTLLTSLANGNSSFKNQAIEKLKTLN